MTFSDRRVFEFDFLPRTRSVLFSSPQGRRVFEERSQEIEALLFLQRLVDQGNQFCNIERLQEISCGAVADAFHGRFETAVPGDDDDLHLRVIMLNVLEEIDPLAIGKFLVERNQVDMLFLQDL